MQTTVLSGRMHSWDTEEHLAPGAKFRHGQPILKKHVFNDTVCGLAPSGLFQLFLPTFEVKADNSFMVICLYICQTG